METHPAGFYRVKREDVWLDLSLKENHPWKSESEIPNAGTGKVTGLAHLCPVPDEAGAAYSPVYALPGGTEVTVVSTELVPSQSGGSRKYYKVAFNGSDKTQNNAVNYLAYKVPGMYYIDSRYLDFTKKGVTVPEGSKPARIANAKSKTPVYAYASKDAGSEKLGILSNDYETWSFPSESDSSWTTIWFSGQKLYVQTKYITQADYKVTDISNLVLADIKGTNLIYKWNKGVNNVDFSCKIIARYGKLQKVIYSNDHVKKPQLTVKSSYLDEAEGNIYIVVQANNINGGKGKQLVNSFSQTDTAPLSTNGLVAQKTKIGVTYTQYGNKKYYNGYLGYCIQVSTNKNFKNARTIQKTYTENGVKKYKPIFEITKLKPNTTYYIRVRYMEDIDTAAGKKQYPTRWSKALKMKTKK